MMPAKLVSRTVAVLPDAGSQALNLGNQRGLVHFGKILVHSDPECHGRKWDERSGEAG
jgi:hypothetical protein